MSPSGSTQDPMGLVWAALRSAEVGRWILVADPYGRVAVVERCADGSRQVVVEHRGDASPSGADDASLRGEAVAAQLERLAAVLPVHQSTVHPVPAGVVPLARHDRRRAEPLDAWLLRHASEDARCVAAAHGQPLTCDRCRPGERCWRCAGTGLRRSQATAQLCNPTGGRAELDVGASAFELLRLPRAQARRRARSLAGPAERLALRLREEVVARAATQLGMARRWPVVLYTAGRARLVHGVWDVVPDGQARPEVGGGAGGSGGEGGAGGSSGVGGLAGAVLATLLQLVPGGFDPAHPPRWVPEADLPRHRREVTLDAQGRVSARMLQVHEPVAPSVWWARILDVAGVIQTRLPPGWEAEASLASTFIATGEYGAHVALTVGERGQRAGRRTVEQVIVSDFGAGLAGLALRLAEHDEVRRAR